ncbi:hypothetical protein PFISCL1PPCAC_26248 [Pristionchus fissidentatus]|uniref:E2F/DP family winged-helix DNA-binding domain-containing protein n=1 Tax=Pristionchus fissidentatus TaxID=1538716 RepID=A0AAV5WRN4_9BILA|nr:hypothetical protein PFISCL1PPCAC_26248 [Pristionchus fissidentatus]
MDPSMISLADSPSTSSRRPSMGAPSNRFNYDLNEELGPDPTEGSTDWLALFDVHPRSKQLQQPVPVKRRKTTQQLQHRGPSLHVPSFELRRVKTEEEEFEEDVAAVVAAAAAAEPPMAKVRQPRPTNNLQQPHQRAAMRKETATIRDGRGSPTTPGGRLENSLLVLTKKFMELKNRSEELNLNEAAATLGVQKRRLYDITNVLEGIELVVKTGKNSIRWCQSGDETAPSECAEKEIMEEELRGMEAEEKRLDDLIRDLSNAFALVKEDPTDKPYAYVNFSDVHKAADDVGSEKMTIAVKSASSDATIEVADPVETGRFEMSIRCAQGLHAMLIPSGKTETAGGGGAVGVGEEEGRRTARDLNAPGTFTADGDVAGQQENGDIVLPSTTTGMSTLRQPCDDLITPSKMVEDNSCLSEYLSPLKFLVGTPMGLLHSTHDSPYLSIDTPNNSSVLQPGSSHPSTSAAAAAAYYHPSFLDGSGPSISDMYSNDDWF